MTFSIQTNIQSLTAQRHVSNSRLDLARTLERLSSGLRINRAADDAAGLAISEKLKTQVRGLAQAIENTQDGINLIQTAEGAMNESLNILQRLRELAIRSATDVNVNTDRQKIQVEFDQLLAELDRIAFTTEFNERKLLDGSLEGGSIELKPATAEVAANIRVGDNNLFPLDIRDFVAQLQSVGSAITIDTAISFKLVANDTGGVGMEVRSSTLGLITLVQDVGLLNSSLFGVPIDTLAPGASLVTVNLNKGGFISGPVDRNTSFNDLMLVERISPISSGNFDITVGVTNYSIAINTATDTVNSVIASINALSNATHTFAASFNDVTSRFSIAVTSTDTNTYSTTANYISTQPPNVPGPAGNPPAAGYPTLDLLDPGDTFPPGGVELFPNLDAAGLNTTVTIADTVAGGFVSAVGGIGAAAAGQNRLITAYTAPTFDGTSVNGADHDEFDLTTRATFTSVTSRDTNQSAFVVVNDTSQWRLPGAGNNNLPFNDGNIDIAFFHTDGTADTVTVFIDDNDSPDTTMTNILAALNATAQAGETFAGVSADGSAFSIQHTIAKVLPAGSNTAQAGTAGFIPADAPIPFGGTTGPNNFVGSGVVPAPYPDPGGVGPPLVLSVTFGGNSNLENALFLADAVDGGDTVTNTYDGTVTQVGGMHHNYTLSTTQNETITDTSTVTSTQRVGLPFQVSPDDIGQMAVVQVHGAVNSVEQDNALVFQVGANQGQTVRVALDGMTAKDLGVEALKVIGNTDADSNLKAQNAIAVVDEAIEIVSRSRSRLGAMQNRLEMSIASAAIAHENLSSSYSRIREADFAHETAQLTRAQIIAQAGVSILAQANIQPQEALRLLTGR